MFQTCRKMPEKNSKHQNGIVLERKRGKTRHSHIKGKDQEYGKTVFKRKSQVNGVQSGQKRNKKNLCLKGTRYRRLQERLNQKETEF
jgi:hypothetical protein